MMTNKPVPNTRDWHLYIVRCKDNTLYSGITTNVEKRVNAHNKGTGAKYTIGRTPVTLVYTEALPNISAARKREAQVKKLSRAQKETLAANCLNGE